MIKAPRPRSAPIHSPTIAPSTDVVDAIFSAEKRNGSELGTRSFQNTSARLADSTRISSSDCGFTDVRPRTMLARVGKKQMNAAITTLEVMPRPKMRTRIGALARIGIVLMNTAIGYSAASRRLECTNVTATRIATVLPMRKPTKLSTAVESFVGFLIGNTVAILEIGRAHV